MNDTRDRKISELTIADITERMLQFAMCSELVDASDFPESYNEGISDALTEMRRDMDTLTERQFNSVHDDCEELIRILAATQLTMREKITKG